MFDSPITRLDRYSNFTSEQTAYLQVAVAQFTVQRDPEHNLNIIDNYASKAARRGARLLLLPEGLIARDGNDDRCTVEHAQPMNSPFVRKLRRISAMHGITLMGTIHILPEGTNAVHNVRHTLPTDMPGRMAAGEPDRRVSNVFVVVSGGKIAYTYDKLHLYDAFATRESDMVRPGDELPPVVDIDGWRVGVMTCYDVRFPEMARSLAARGAEVIAVSAAWVRGEYKQRHWELMTAARAVENTCYVLACSEVSNRNIGLSRIIDPMGNVIAQADDANASMIDALLRRDVLESARVALPLLDNRRFADPELR
ncbi:nitrilase-related carbon-nitrogen hydrolase [Bifidobacterium goeldii]